MSVNGTVDILSNCTFQYESKCFKDSSYDCMDAYPGKFLTGAYILMNAIFMLPLNCWILWLARRTKGVASSDFVIFNQSVSEIISEISLTVFLACVMLNMKILALISSYLCSTFIVGRPLFQTFFCVERYLAVVHPLVYLKYTKCPKFKLQLVGLVWIIILILGWFIVDSFPKMPIWFYMGLFLSVTIVCTICSVMILLVLKRPKPGEGDKEGAFQLKRKAFVAITVIMVTLFIGYGTLTCVIVLRDYLSYQTYCLVLGLSWWTFLPSSAVQPYLYLSKMGAMNKLPCINQA